MTSGPEFTLWRIELLHPLFLHFPIALLPCGCLLLTLAFIRPLSRKVPFLLQAAWLLITLGTLFAWAAVWTGNRAEEEVNRYLCDPTLTHAHGDLSECATWAFSFAVSVFVAQRLLSRRYSVRRAYVLLSHGIIFASLSFGLVTLIRATHLGAGLVYLQGAAVYRPSPECREFE